MIVRGTGTGAGDTGHMIKKVRKYIEENHMIMPGDVILAGVSGGADSICLFFLLQSLCRELAFEFMVMHVNHNLRKTARRDELFVQSLCESYGIPFFARQVEVTALAFEKHLSVEEAARIARYDAFYRQMRLLHEETGKEVKLALAHHENDQAETVLFHLFRGSSLTGLRGMKPVTKQKELFVIRPLLCVDRKEIESVLQESGLSYMTDETNADNRYARNRIRNEILASASRFICQESAKHIAQTASDLAKLEDYLDAAVQAEYESVVQAAGDGRTLQIFAAAFEGRHSYIRQEIIYRAIAQLAGVRRDITRVHVEHVCRLFSMQVGRWIDLPYGICAKREYDSVKLFVKDHTRIAELNSHNRFSESKACDGQEKWEIPLRLQGITRLPDGSVFTARIFSYEKEMEIPKNKYTKWFNYDKIKQCPVVRTRRISDYFYIDDLHTQKCKDYMINEKIKQSDRDKLCLVCLDHHMLWMPGYRISAFYKVCQDTKQVLELTYQDAGGTKDGGQNQCHDIGGGNQ